MGISRQDIEKATAKGDGAGAVADRLGLTVVQLRSACRQHGIQPPQLRRQEIEARLPRDFLRTELKTKTVAQIAAAAGLPESTVRGQLDRLGLRPDPAVVNESRRQGAAKAWAEPSGERQAMEREMPAIDLEAPGDPMGKLLQGATYADSPRAAVRRHDFMRGLAPMAGGMGCSSLVRE